jgi:hypothetical protein
MTIILKNLIEVVLKISFIFHMNFELFCNSFTSWTPLSSVYYVLQKGLRLKDGLPVMHCLLLDSFILMFS